MPLPRSMQRCRATPLQDDFNVGPLHYRRNPLAVDSDGAALIRSGIGRADFPARLHLAR